MDRNTTPQLRPSETESRSMDSSTTLPQVRPSETESGSMDSSTTQQLPTNINMQPEAGSRRSMGGSGSGSGSSSSTPPQLPPNLNDLQPEPYTWTSTTKVRREDGTIQVPPNFNVEAMKSLQRPPLGLKLEITPEFVAKWTSAQARPQAAVGRPPKKVAKPPPASIIPATSISIGPNWRKESRREDHLTLKLYFAKKKLIWEFLEGSLKEKIEVSWSDIIAINAHILPHDQPGLLLQIQLGKKPLFFRENPPKPTKHTTWKKTTDFTHGYAASRHWIHEAKFGEGVLDAHYAKLLQRDQRLLALSKNPFPSTTAACLQQQTLTTSVNNPTRASPSHLNPSPSPSSFTAGGVGESSRNANLHQTPVLLPSASPQQLPLSFTGVEQSLPFDNPTPSIQASHLFGLGEYDTHTAQIGGHHSSFVSFLDSSQLLQGMSYNQPLLDLQELNQTTFQINNPTHINNIVPANTYHNNQQPTLEMENTALHHQQMVSSRKIRERSVYMQGESSSSSSRNGDHHQTPLLALGDDSTAHIGGHYNSSHVQASLFSDSRLLVSNSQPLAEERECAFLSEFNQFQSGSNIYGGEQWQELGYNNYFGSGLTADPEQARPELDGDGNTGNDSMDLYSIIRSANINRRST